MVGITGTGFVVPVKLGPLRLRMERVSQSAGGFDKRLQALATDHPLKGERPILVFPEGARWDGGGEGANLERDRLGKGIDPIACAAASAPLSASRFVATASGPG